MKDLNKLDPAIRFQFNFDEEIPELNIKSSISKKIKKTKIEIFKPKKNGKRDCSTNNTGLF